VSSRCWRAPCSPPAPPRPAPPRRCSPSELQSREPARPRARTRFVFPTIGHIYDENGQSLIEFARDIWRDAAAPVVGEAVSKARTAALPRHASPEESDWLLHHATNIRAFSP
jgi:hypothetical protein